VIEDDCYGILYRSILRMRVTDNGAGFKLPKTRSNLVRVGKLGLVGMEERARLVNGRLTINSQPGKGTSVIVEVPFESLST